MYKVKASNWQGYNIVSLDISVGKPYHEGEKFKAAIDWVNRRGFSKCIIQVADSLQRHNLIGTENSHQAAVQSGNQWIRRNLSAIKSLECGYEIIRWDQWLDHPGFSEAARLITTRYATDPVFKQAVQQDAKCFTKRNPYSSKARCIQYILEELTVQTLIDHEYDLLMAYPSNQNQSSKLHATCGFARLNFHKRKCPALIQAA